MMEQAATTIAKKFIRSDFCALMHESGVIQNSPIAFFTASPKVCGEVAIFAKGDKEQVSRDWKQTCSALLDT